MKKLLLQQILLKSFHISYNVHHRLFMSLNHNFRTIHVQCSIFSYKNRKFHKSLLILLIYGYICLPFYYIVILLVYFKIRLKATLWKYYEKHVIDIIEWKKKCFYSTSCCYRKFRYFFVSEKINNLNTFSYNLASIAFVLM